MENLSLNNHNTFDVTYKLDIKVNNLIYAVVVTFFVFCSKSVEESLKLIAEAVKDEALALCLPDSFSLSFSDAFGQVAKVQVMKKTADIRWAGETALMRMIDDGRLIVVGDKLRLTDHLSIGDLDRYGITRQYLVDLGYLETITGKDLTIANLNYHLNK